MRELLTLYAHELRANHHHSGDATALPRVTPYRDYLAWIARQDHAAAVAAWREALSGLEEPTYLVSSSAPRERTRVPAVPEQVALTLSEELTAALTRQARSQGLTLNTYVQAAWGILLGRLTGRDDVVFGVTVAGRPPEIAGIESMVGLFINTLPLRLQLPPGKPFVELLRDLQDSQSRLIAHQHLGLAEIQGLAGLGDLFDTLTVFENYPVDETGSGHRNGGLRLTGIAGHDATHYPLSLLAAPGERLRLRLDYRADLFTREAVEAIGGRLVRLLTTAVEDPARAIGSLDILSPAERRTILTDWNDTARDIPDITLPELFAEQATRTPDAVALVYEDRTLSYRELDQRANQLAHHLRSLGAAPETIVGVCVERSFDMVIALLAILKAGAAYLPLDPDYPAERLAFMLQDAGAPVLVTQSSLRARLPTHTARIVDLDVDQPTIARLPASAPHHRIDPRTAAYVIYTSGSTGQPKGVAVTHAGLANHMRWMRYDYPTDESDIVLARTAISFDAAEWEVWLPLVTGATLCIAPTAVTRDPDKLAGFIEHHGITVAQFVPSLLEPVMSAAAAGALSRLKRLFLGGEALSAIAHARGHNHPGRANGQSLRPDRDDDPDRIVANRRCC